MALIFSVVLAGCGSGGGSGGGGAAQPIVLGAVPTPQIAGAPTGTQSGTVTIPYKLTASNFTTVTVKVQYSVDGSEFRDATPGAGGDGTSGLSASPDGAPHVFVWDSIADIGRRKAQVRFRIVPVGGTEEAITPLFEVDNPPEPKITGFSPTVADAGVATILSITGQSLSRTTAVSIVSATGAVTSLTNLSVASDTNIFATIPASAVGGAYTIQVDTSAGTALGTVALNLFDAAANVTSITPTSGTGSAPVTLRVFGSRFDTAFGIRLENVDTLLNFDLANFVKRSTTEVSGQIPGGIASGSYNVYVLNKSRTGKSQPGIRYTATRIPFVQIVSPASAPNTSAAAVTINGENFAGVTSGILQPRGGGTTGRLENLVIDSNTQIRATVPVFLKPGIYDIVLTNASGVGTFLSTATFTITEEPPIVESVVPSSLLNTSGRRISVNGRNLLGTKRVFFDNVTFGRRTFTPTFIVSQAQVQVDVPAFLPPGDYDVTVENTVGTSTSSAVLTVTEAAPVLTALAPNSGVNNTETLVKATGRNLLGSVEVTLTGPRPSTVVAQVLVPSVTATDHTSASFSVLRDLRPGDYGVKIRNTAGTSNELTYTAREAIPTVTGLVPSSLQNDNIARIQIQGTGFFGAFRVELIGPQTVSLTPLTATSNTELEVDIPARLRPGNYTVRVTNTAGSSSGGPTLAITEPLPLVTAVLPSTSSNVTGTFITVTGDHFLGATALEFTGPESFTVSPVTVSSINSLTAVVPPSRRPGVYQLRVTNSTGTSISFVTFTISEGAPVIRTIAPPAGSNTRFTQVTLTGDNLSGTFEAVLSKQGSTFTATIGGADIIVDSINQIRVFVPPDLQPGLYDFRVRNTVGTSNALTYSVSELKPALTSITPSTGPADTAQSITVNGANLLGVFQFTLHPFETNPILAARQVTRNFTVPQPTSSTSFPVTIDAPIFPGAYRATAVNTAARSDLTTAPVYRVLENLPVLTQIAPSSVAFDVQTTVTISGTGLLGTLSVRFDRGTTFFDLVPTRVIDDTRVEVTLTPPVTAAAYTVTTTNTAGRSNGLAFNSSDAAFKDRQFSTALAITPDNSTLFVANGSVSRVTYMAVAANGQLTKSGEIVVGGEPTNIAVTPQGTKAYVTNRTSGTVSVIDVASRLKTSDITVGTEPYGCVLTPTGRFLFVSNTMSNTISVIDTQTDTVVSTIALPAGEYFPFALACTNDGDTDDLDEKVYVTQYFGELPSGARPNAVFGDLDNGRVGKVTVLDVATRAIRGTVTLSSFDSGFTADRTAFGGSATAATAAWPNMLAHVVVRGPRAYVVNGAISSEGPVRFNVNEQAYISVIDTATDTESTGQSQNMNLAARGETPQGRFFNTPWGMAFSPASNTGYMLSAASDVALQVTVSPTGTIVATGPATAQSSRGVVRVPVGKNPRSIIFDTSGQFAFVHNYISRDVSVIDRTTNTVIDTESSIALPGAGSLAASILRGEELFNTSIGTSSVDGSSGRMSDNGWGSCFSCHPFGWTDTAVWSFASGPRKTISMHTIFAKTDPADQRVLNWSAVNDEVSDFELNIRTVSSNASLTAGTDSPHGLILNTLRSNITPLIPLANGGRSPDWTNIEDYVKFGIRSPISPLRGTDVSIGRQAFQAAGCTECHGGAKFTSSTRSFTPPPTAGQISAQGEILEVLKQVDTFLPTERTSVNGVGRGANGFNPPSLIGFWAFPPFFHNGQASTVEEVLDRVLNSIPHRNIGIPNILDNPSTKAELVKFLKSIDDATPPFRGSPEPTSSSSLALTPDGQFLFVANISTPTVSFLQLDTANSSVTKLGEIATGQEPTSIAIIPEGTRAYVTNRASGTVSVIDVATRTKTADITVGAEPCGCALTPTGRFLYVANSMSNTVSVIDTQSNAVLTTIPLPSSPTQDRFPFAVAVTNDGDLVDSDEKVYVTQYFGQLPSGQRPDPDFGDSDVSRIGKVTVISVNTQSIIRTIQLAPKATGFDADRSAFTGNPSPDNQPTSAWPNMLASIVIRGNRAYVVNGATSSAGPVKFDVNEQAFISVIDTVADTEVTASTINMNLAAKGESPQGFFFNTPWGMAVAPGGVSGYVLSAASDIAVRVAFQTDGSPVITGAPNAQSSAGITRVQVGKNPRSVIFNRTGTRAFVHNYIGRSVSVIDAGSDTVVTTVASAAQPTPGSLAASVLRGEELFNTSRGVSTVDGSPDRMSDHGWGSCFSCHAFGWTDTAVWSFGSGPRKSSPMNASFSKIDQFDQRLFNWSAVNDEVADFELNIRTVSSDPALTAGANSPQGLMVGIARANITPLLPLANTGRASDWTDIENYAKFGIRSPISPLRGTDVSAGRAAFVAAGCVSCHNGAKWTSSRRNYTPPPGVTVNVTNGQVVDVLRNVDTFRPSERTSNNTAARGADGFNPPSLLSWWAFPPYFHNGSASSADEVLERVINSTAHKNAGNPGMLDNPTTKANLIQFLLSIDDATPPF